MGNIRICGGHNPESEEALAHAETYYNSIRKRFNDIKRISKNTGLPLEKVSLIKGHLFYNYHNLGYEEISHFDPDYYIAESWRRLSDKNKSHIQQHDIILLQHELLEIDYIIKGYNQNEAHTLASNTFDYSTTSRNYYKKLGHKL